MDRCLQLVRSYQKVKRISVQQLESLTGLLNFACSVVAPGRPFMRRLYQLTWGMKRRIPHFKLKLTKGVKEDLETWEKFFVKYNRITMFLPNEPELDKDLNLETAVPTIGFGLVYGNKWTYRVWPEEWLSFQETTREVFSILLVIKLFGTELRNRRLKLHKEDHKLVKIINIQSVKDPNTTVLIRNMVLSLMLHNIQLTATTTTDMSNHLAVLLSNQQVQEFMQTNPTARKQPEIIPADPQPKKYTITSNAF